MTRVVTKRVNKLTPGEYRACYNLNMRGNGLMREALVIHKRDNDARATLAIEDGKIVGWALVFESFGNHDNDGKIAYFYVRKEFRRKGIGKKLMRSVRRVDSSPQVVPWNKTSGEFFKRYRKSVKIDRWDQHWINS